MFQFKPPRGVAQNIWQDKNGYNEKEITDGDIQQTPM